MTHHKKDEATPAAAARGYEPLTPEEFQRLVAEAKERGEPTTPLVKRLVLTTIDEVAETLKARRELESDD